jgi:hypothetical protein
VAAIAVALWLNRGGEEAAPLPAAASPTPAASASPVATSTASVAPAASPTRAVVAAPTPQRTPTPAPSASPSSVPATPAPTAAPAAVKMHAEVEVSHLHRLGYCVGKLIVQASTVEYISRDRAKDSRKWNYSDLRDVELGSGDTLSFLAFEPGEDGGSRKKHTFHIVEGEIPASVLEHLKSATEGPGKAGAD